MAKKKLVIWDLDNTIWDGVISEDVNVTLKEGIVDIITTIDKRGILQSIASKNDEKQAMEQLKKFNLDEYFLYPKINWSSKSENITSIVKKINISMDTVAFVDDQPFEREEVKFNCLDIDCIDANVITGLLERDDMNPNYITQDSKLRRTMYQSDAIRNEKEEEFKGTKEEFLRSLEMKMVVEYAKKEDLQRAEELTVRTHQLNSTGYTYSYDELKSFIEDDKYKLFIVDLNDKYGYYGKIGIVLIECEEKNWTLKLLLTSCRVMSRGIGNALLGLLVNMAIDQGVKLRAEFVPTERNRIMAITYSLMGFHICEKDDKKQVLQYMSDTKVKLPEYIDIKVQY